MYYMAVDTNKEILLACDLFVIKCMYIFKVN